MIDGDTNSWNWYQNHTRKKEGYPDKWIQDYLSDIRTQGKNPTIEGFKAFAANITTQHALNPTEAVQKSCTTATTAGPLSHDPNTPLIKNTDPKTFASVVDPFKYIVRNPLLKNLGSMENLSVFIEEYEHHIQEYPQQILLRNSKADQALDTLLKYFFLRGCQELKVLDEQRLSQDLKRDSSLELQSSYFKTANLESILSLYDQLQQVWASAAVEVAKLLEKNIPQNADMYDVLVITFESKLLSGNASIAQWIKELSEATRNELHEFQKQSFFCPIPPDRAM